MIQYQINKTLYDRVNDTISNRINIVSNDMILRHIVSYYMT